MGLLSKIGMIEATRLTREGKIPEAMTALRKMLTGSGLPLSSFRSAARSETQWNKESVIDMLPPSQETGSSWIAPPPGEKSSTVLKRKISLPLTGKLKGFVEGLPERGFPDWLGRGDRAGKTSARPDLEEGATFEDYSFANAAGSRTYKLYVPSGYDGGALPLIVMLHGCTQSPDDFAAGTRMNEIAEEQNFIVAYPAQSKAANSSKCWNWFNPTDQQRGKGEASLIAGITIQIMGAFSIDARRVYVAGLSAGGAAAAIMGQAYPDLYAAIGVHSGLPCGAARDVASAFAAMKHGNKTPKAMPHAEGRIIPTIVFHGDADTTVDSVNGDDIISQSKSGLKLEKTVTHGRSAGGTKYTRIVEQDGNGQLVLEQWRLHGAGHAWSGGSPTGSFTDPAGPDASREMIRFFLSAAEAGFRAQ
jgi:poly(hydroxyalkanoate) depolymerase family esterase